MGTIADTIAIGLIISSAFSAMVVYAQELTPGNVGAVAGLFFGLSFGLGGVGAALLGILADRTSLAFVYQVCAFLPAIGLLGGFLPEPRPGRPPRRRPNSRQTRAHFAPFQCVAAGFSATAAPGRLAVDVGGTPLDRARLLEVSPVDAPLTPYSKRHENEYSFSRVPHVARLSPSVHPARA